MKVKKLKSNLNLSFQGMQPEKKTRRYKIPTRNAFEKNYLTGRDLNQNPNMSPSRYIIDIPENFYNNQHSLRKKIENFKKVIICSRISKYSLFTMINNHKIVFSDSLTVFTSSSFFLMGILSSKLHIVWAKHQGSTFNANLRYTNTSCFETFPLPKDFF